MGCCESIVKTFLFATNLLIFLLSCAVVGLGFWILFDRPSLVNLLDQTEATIPIYDSAVILFLIVAFSAIFVSFFGCCGAYKESRCMLGTYFLLLLCLLILIVVGTVIGFSQGIDSIINPLKDTLYMYDETSSRVDVKEITQLWDEVQTDLRCCGVESARDWSQQNPRYNGEGYIEDQGAILMGPKVPRSCCATSAEQGRCMRSPSGKNGAYMVGCYVLLSQQISDHINIVGGIATAVIAVMVINLLIALYMCTCALTEDTDVLGRPTKRNYTRTAGYGRP